ncbi:MAG TPA: hypothetical protein VM432_13755, partial [Bdellovibrionales bacterium]|nr:hypothetical protein [Bdellovibrionales bacterium]
MSLMTGYNWKHDNIRLLGYSVAGISTSVAFPEAEVCFDVAQGLPYQIQFPNILITHGHMDHASGLPYLIAMKSMMSQALPQIYMPRSLIKPMTNIMKIWHEIDQHEYRFNFIPIEEDREYELKPPFFFKAFKTFHRVDSHGYTIFER